MIVKQDGVMQMGSSVVRFVQTADAAFLVLLAGLFAQWIVDPSSGYLVHNWMTLNVAMFLVAMVCAGTYMAVKAKLDSQKNSTPSPATK